MVYFLPNEIQTDARFNVRPSSADDDGEIERLAQSIEESGQIDPGVVVPVNQTDEGEDYILLIGHRRRRAITLINTKYALLGKPLLKMKVAVDRSTRAYSEQLRHAIASNLHRKSFTPMDLALLIQRLKTENKWIGYQGSKKVADFLGVNPATVTQHERLLGADASIQAGVSTGKLSAQSAFDLLSVKPEKLEEVNERSAQAAPTGRAKNNVVKRAIRETEEATARVVSRTRKEIISFFEDLDAPAYGYPDGAIRQFATYFQSWTQGGGTARTLTAKFDAMTAKAPQGTKSSAEKSPKKGK